MSNKKPRFFAVSKIRADTGSAGRLDIYGDIDATQFWGDEITPSAMLTELNELGAIDQLDVHVFSNGGDVFAGLAIYSILRQRQETVNVYIEGIAASIATVITCAGDHVYISDTGMMMLHNPFTMLFFESLNANGARELANELDKARQPMIHAYAAKTGKSDTEIAAILDGNSGKGTWFTAAEAIEFGLADAYIPDEKRPRDLAAQISPAVFRWRGHTVDMSKYPDAARRTANINKKAKGEKKQMPRKKAGRKRAEVTLIDMVCPHCSADVLLNPDTAEVILSGADSGDEGGDEAGTSTTQARRTKGNMRAEIFTVNCPGCGEEFIWDTDAAGDGDTADPVTETTPMGAGQTSDVPAQAKRRQATAKRKQAKKKAKLRAELAEALCPNCSAIVPYDTATADITTDENGIEGYDLECPECGEEFIEALESTEPEAIPVDTPAPVAYRMGILAERQRMLALDEMSQAAPGLESMITSAKRSGASAQAMSRNIFKAMAQKSYGGHHLAARERDAERSNVNGLQMPRHFNKREVFAQTVTKRLEDR